MPRVDGRLSGNGEFKTAPLLTQVENALAVILEDNDITVPVSFLLTLNRNRRVLYHHTIAAPKPFASRLALMCSRTFSRAARRIASLIERSILHVRELVAKAPVGVRLGCD
jgi:hypothetical protein